MQISKNNSAFWLVYFVHCLHCVLPVAALSVFHKYNLTKILHVNMDKKDNSDVIPRTIDGTGMDPMDGITTMPKIRVKRQSGGGKYTDAAKMPQVKILRLVLQMFRNSWADAYVGGAHPLHHEVPKPIVELFKQRIIEFFFPDVGAENDKDK